MDFSSWYETTGPQRNAFNKYKKAQEDALNERNNYFTQPDFNEDMQPQGVLDGLFSDFDVDVDDIFSGNADFYNTSNENSPFMNENDSTYSWDFSNVGKDQEQGDYVTQKRVGNNKQIKGIARYDLEQTLLGNNNKAWGYGKEHSQQTAKGKDNTLYGWSDNEVGQVLSGYNNTAYGYAKEGIVNQSLDGIFNIFNKLFGKGKEVNQNIGESDKRAYGNYARAHGDDVSQTAFGDRNWLRGSGGNIHQNVDGNYNIFDAMGDEIVQNIDAGYGNRAIAYGTHAEQNVSDDAFFSTLISYAETAQQTGSANSDNIFTMGGDIFANDGDDFIKTMDDASSGSIDAGDGDDIVKIGKGKDKKSSWDVVLGEGSDVVKVDVTGYKGTLKVDGSGGNDKLVLDGGKFDESDIKIELDEDTGEHVITVGSGSKQRTYRTTDIEDLEYTGTDGKVHTMAIEEKDPERKVINLRDDDNNPDNKDLTGESDYKETTINMLKGDDKVKLDGSKDMDGLKIVGGEGDDTANIVNVDESKKVTVTDLKDGKYKVEFTDKNGKARSFETESLENLSINSGEAKKLADLAEEPDNRKVISGRDDANNPDCLNLTGEANYKDTTVDLKKGDDKVKLDGSKDMDGLKIVGGEGDDTANIVNVDESKKVTVTDLKDGKYKVEFTDKNGKARFFETESLENLSINSGEAKKLADLAKEPDNRKVISGRDDANNPDSLDLTGEVNYKDTTVDLKKGDDKVKLDGAKDMDGLKIVGGEGDDTANIVNVDESKKVTVTDLKDGKYKVEFTDKNGKARFFETESLENLSINSGEAKKLADLAKEPDNRKVISGRDDANNPDSLDLTGEVNYKDTTVDLKKGDDKVKLDGAKDMDGLKIVGGEGDDTANIVNVDESKKVTVTDLKDGKYKVEFTDKNGKARSFETESLENLSINSGTAKKLSGLATGDLPDARKEDGTSANNTMDFTTGYLKDKYGDDLRNLTIDGKAGDDTIKVDGLSKTEGLKVIGGDGDADTLHLTSVDAGTVEAVKTADGKYTLTFKDTSGASHSIAVESLEKLKINDKEPVGLETLLPPDARKEDGTSANNTMDFTTGYLKDKYGDDLRNLTIDGKAGDDTIKVDGLSKTEGLKVIGGDGDADTLHLTSVDAGTVEAVKTADGKYTLTFKDTSGASHSIAVESLEKLKINDKEPVGIETLLPPDARKEDGTSANNTMDFTTGYLKDKYGDDLRNLTIDGKAGDDTIKVDGLSKTEGLKVIGGDGDADTLHLTSVDAGTVEAIKTADGKYTLTFKDTSGASHSIAVESLEKLKINDKEPIGIETLLPPDARKEDGTSANNTMDFSTGYLKDKYGDDLRNLTIDGKAGDDTIKVDGLSKTEGLKVIGGDGDADTLHLTNIDEGTVEVLEVFDSNLKKLDGQYLLTFKDTNGTSHSIAVESLEKLKINDKEPVGIAEFVKPDARVLEQGTRTRDNANTFDFTTDPYLQQQYGKDLRSLTIKGHGGDDTVKFAADSKTDGLVVDGGNGDHDKVTVDGAVTLKSITPTANANEYTISYEVDVNGKKETRTFVVKDIEDLEFNGTKKSVADWIKELKTPDDKDVVDLNEGSVTDLSKKVVDTGVGDDLIKFDATSKTNEGSDKLTVKGGEGTDTVEIRSADDKAKLKEVKDNKDGTFTVSYVDEKGDEHAFITEDVENIKIGGQTFDVEDAIYFTDKDFQVSAANLPDGRKLIGTTEANTLDVSGFSGDISKVSITPKGQGVFEVTIDGKKVTTKDIEGVRLADTDGNVTEISLTDPPEYLIRIAEKDGDDTLSVDTSKLPAHAKILGNADDTIKLTDVDTVSELKVEKDKNKPDLYHITDTLSGKQFDVEGDVSLQGIHDATPVKISVLAGDAGDKDIPIIGNDNSKSLADIAGKKLVGDDDDTNPEDKDILKLTDTGLTANDIKEVKKNSDGTYTVTIKDTIFTVDKLEAIEFVDPDHKTITIEFDDEEGAIPIIGNDNSKSLADIAGKKLVGDDDDTNPEDKDVLKITNSGLSLQDIGSVKKNADGSYEVTIKGETFTVDGLESIEIDGPQGSKITIDFEDLISDEPSVHYTATEGSDTVAFGKFSDIPKNLVIDGKTGADKIDFDFLTEEQIKVKKLSTDNETYEVEITNPDDPTQKTTIITKNLESFDTEGSGSSLESHASNVVPLDGHAINVNDLAETIFGRVGKTDDNLHLTGSGLDFADITEVKAINGEPGNYKVTINGKTYTFVGVESITIGTDTKSLNELSRRRNIPSET